MSINKKTGFEYLLDPHKEDTMLVYLMLMLTTIYALDYDWSRLHRCMTPNELRQTVEDYQENFPCIDCRDHFKLLLEQHPFPLDYVKTTEDVRVWTWYTHNLVNERLNKSWESFDIMLDCYQPESTYDFTL